MRILISGVTGLVGHALSTFLRTEGHEVSALRRRREGLLPGDLFWNPSSGVLSPNELSGFDAVIHLAGENISGQRWSPAFKGKILKSRVNSTRLLAEALTKLAEPPKCFITASATGFYGNRENERIEESSGPGAGFLADVCQAWEEAAAPATKAGIRTINLRIGMVLSALGGALSEMRLPFEMGLGATLGNGKQHWSWITLHDLVHLIHFGLIDEGLSGPVNAVAPQPVTNEIFTDAFAEVVGKPRLLGTPKWATRSLLGEMAEALLLASTRAFPEKALAAGFTFEHANIKEGISAALNKIHRNDKWLRTETWLPKAPADVFPFFCTPQNLELLTPPWLNFRITDQSTSNIQQNTEFAYKLQIHGLPVTWRSRILDWAPNVMFSDTQLSGPYAKWYHRHRFFEHRGGTLMTDEVQYRLPLGSIGNTLGGNWVKKDVDKIFSYRKDAILRHFAES